MLWSSTNYISETTNAQPSGLGAKRGSLDPGSEPPTAGYGGRVTPASEDSEVVNLKQAAIELDVHYMTAYRYVRTGRLDASRRGTAWVVSRAALDDFRRGPASEPTAMARGRTDWSERLAVALVSGDEPAGWKILEQALTSGRTPADCYLDVLSGALREIDDEAPEGDHSRGYLATATATRLVARLGARFRRPGRSRGTVVFGAPLGEHHSLPIAIVADLIRLEGFTCLELGADVPPRVFAHAAANAHRLLAVGIGTTTAAAGIDNLRTTITAVVELVPDVPIILGGQAVLNPDMASLHGATHWAADGSQAIEIINALASTGRHHAAALTSKRD